jgi:large subunit ribosomal protein L9
MIDSTEDAMKVILVENVPSVGKAGDVMQVATGFGRNFLIPKKLALEATPANIKHLEKQKESFFSKANKEKLSATELASKIDSLSCDLPRTVGENEKLFGSVTSMDLQEYLSAQGIQMDRRKIVLPHPIKNLGSFSVPIKLHAGVTAQLKLNVIPAEPAKETP